MKKLSIFLSLILRHNPGKIGIKLDANGWADVQELCKAMPISLEVLKEIVRTDNKGRYSFNSDQTKIRANQGHSIDVDVELKQTTPPEELYHGTSLNVLDKIKQGGILPMSRQHVHLSANYDTAIKTGSRHGKPIVLIVQALKMHEGGQIFYLSENGVWLTSRIGPEFIKE